MEVIKRFDARLRDAVHFLSMQASHPELGRCLESRPCAVDLDETLGADTGAVFIPAPETLLVSQTLEAAEDAQCRAVLSASVPPDAPVNLFDKSYRAPVLAQLRKRRRGFPPWRLGLGIGPSSTGCVSSQRPAPP